MMQPEEMNDGVRLLIERMESNPEEFGGEGRWGHLELDQFKDFLYPEEMKMLREKLVETKRHNFTTEVLRVLTGATEPAPKIRTQKTIIVPKDMLEESKKLLSEAFQKTTTVNGPRLAVNLEAI
jgi:hypothetical protein